ECAMPSRATHIPVVIVLGPVPIAIPSSRTLPDTSPTWRSSSRRMLSARISCRAAASSPRHGFAHRFGGIYVQSRFLHKKSINQERRRDDDSFNRPLAAEIYRHSLPAPWVYYDSSPGSHPDNTGFVRLLF